MKTKSIIRTAIIAAAFFAGHVAMDLVKMGIKDGKATHAAMMLKK
ncbi:hypothetical protein [Mucilaginibacter pineti]|nr:hypothetical protein [Mucilaginibacter pineti]